MIDNGAWTVINSPLFFADGNHSYQVRVTDNAGNVTETPMQTLYIDASPAVIAMLDDALVLGDGLFYSIEDSQSGLTELRVVIKDNEGKYKSVTWVENLDGSSKYKDSVRWDGRFSDGTYPTPGIYYIALKVINGAGVETIGTATIEVPVVKTAEQESIPALILPALVETVETVVEEETVVTQPAPQAFGSSNNPFTGNSIQTSFSANSTTTPTQSNTTSNILWGGAAAALLGATLAEWQKKREEEEAARRAAMRNSGGEEEDDRPRKKTPGQIAYEKKQQQKRIVAESQALLNQKKATQQAQSKIAKDKNLAKAEAVMSKVKPSAPYVASSYIDKEEETWLKGVASQGAWAATSDAKSEPVAIVIPLPQPVPTQPDNEDNAETPTPTSTPNPIEVATPSEYRTPANTLIPSSTPALSTTPDALDTVIPILTLTPSPTLPPPPPTPTNPNDKSIIERVVDGVLENVPSTYHYPAEPNLTTGGGGMPGGLNDTNVTD